MEELAHTLQQDLNRMLTASHGLEFQFLPLGAKGVPKNLGEAASPDCYISFEEGVEIARQRDFFARRRGHQIEVALAPNNTDAYFNFLRWLVPRELLKRRTYILHSSAVLVSSGEAVICLGASGAGKTTISSLAQNRRVLGDDMNRVQLENGRLMVGPIQLGQRMESPGTDSYPVVQIYWLHKSDKLSLEKIPETESYIYWLSSLANLFWKYLHPDEIQRIQNEALSVVQSNPFYRLSFPKSEYVWSFIEENIRAY